MDKARQAHIRAEIIDNEISAQYHGMEDDLAEIIKRVSVDLVKNRRSIRRKLRRAMRSAMWQTAPDWMRYLFGDLPATAAGVVILTLAVAGFCWIVHGVCGI